MTTVYLIACAIVALCIVWLAWKNLTRETSIGIQPVRPLPPVPKKPRNERWVVCAAILDSETGRITCGARHHHCLRTIVDVGTVNYVGRPRFTQGFVDQRNEFMTREEALAIARQNDQVAHRCGGDERRLFSENLY